MPVAPARIYPSILRILPDSPPLAAIHQATHPRRWRLLVHAIEEGPFPASRAAEIALLTPTSGTGRTTHADRLCTYGLLKRTGKPAQYSATELGGRVYRGIKTSLEGQRSRPGAPRIRLRRGEHVDLLPADERDASPTFRILRRA
jgi:hypothetical protein